MKEIDLIFEKDDYIEALFVGIKGIFASLLMILYVIVFGVLINNQYSNSLLENILILLGAVVVFSFSSFYINYNLKQLKKIDRAIKKL